MVRTTIQALVVFLFVVGRAAAEERPALPVPLGVEGGLVVHLGSGDGTRTAELGATRGFTVHGLESDPDLVAAARAHIQSRGLYGRVAVDRLTSSSLPYADNLVNVLVAEDLGAVPREECLRVLAPLGVLHVRRDGAWTTTVKPWPETIDEWTHTLHGPGGNAVAADRVVGPPRRLQWTAGPLWARSHGWTPSVTAMVSSRGRLFAICDETLTGADGAVPSKWVLLARDAFSGVLLWRRPLTSWGSEALSGTPDDGHGITTGRFTMPTHAARRLVALGDTVYVTLGATSPVAALEATTGRERYIARETANADEVLVSDGRLIVSINPPAASRPAPVPRDETPPPARGKRVAALDAKTGRLLWKKGPFTAIRAARGQDPFGRLELAASDGRVFFLTADAIQCLRADSGERIWQKRRPGLPDDAVRRVGFAGMYEYLLTVLVVHDGVVLLAQPEPNTHHTYHTMPGTLYAFDARDGSTMWKHPYGGWGHCTPPDVFVVGDVVWTHVDAKTEFGSTWGNGFRAKDTSKVDYRIQALDLRTGELRRELATRDLFNVGHHHRCYRNRITERFLMSSRRGVEFVDLANGENFQHHWVRSGCLLGNLPSNGLLYVAPHPCACYLEAKLTGFNALAPRGRPRGAAPPGPVHRLEKGPAYGAARSRHDEMAGEDGWPTYRHDPARTGATGAPVGAKLRLLWRSSIGAPPSGLVVAGGLVLAAAVDAHTVHALEAADGAAAWTFTTGARVDSPPTIHGESAIFGSRDGCVYCVRLADGQLVWRFRAAPSRRLVTAFDQLESAWPVPGSVVVDRGRCWFAAGRSSYLDGGIHVYALDAVTGEVAHHEVVYSADPETGKMEPSTSANEIPGLLNDVPVGAGGHVCIRQMVVSPGGDRVASRIYPSGGFLDPSMFNRTSWSYRSAKTSGLMVLGGEVAYGVELYPSESRETVFRPGARPFRLKCLPVESRAAGSEGSEAARRKGRAGRPRPVWERPLGIRVTALVRAADLLLAAGSPDSVDPADPHGAWEGRKGGILQVLAAEDGKELATYRLASPPRWDGMAATRGRLYLALESGTIVCYEGPGRGFSGDGG